MEELNTRLMEALILMPPQGSFTLMIADGIMR
jgi:hypothetical protein